MRPAVTAPRTTRPGVLGVLARHDRVQVRVRLRGRRRPPEDVGQEDAVALHSLLDPELDEEPVGRPDPVEDLDQDPVLAVLGEHPELVCASGRLAANSDGSARRTTSARLANRASTPAGR